MILVTGGTGLLGTHVLVELTKSEEKIRALKRKSSDLSHFKKVFDFYFGADSINHQNKIEWVDGDILDIVSLQDAVKDCTIVYHCAALVSFAKRDFKKLIKTNKEGTANVVNVCLGEKIDHLCYVSSTAAIGRAEFKDIYDETNKWISSKHNSGYAVSKYLAENEVWRGVEEGLNAVIACPSVILGPGNWNESSLSIFKVVKKGLKFYTPGLNAFVDARDVASCMHELSNQRIFNERFLTFSENVKFQVLFEKIAKRFGVKAPSILVKPWMTGIVWRLEGLLHFFFGRKQNITRETAHSSMQTTKYSNQKLVDRIGHKFYSIDESIDNAVNYFNLEKK